MKSFLFRFRDVFMLAIISVRRERLGKPFEEFWSLSIGFIAVVIKIMDQSVNTRIGNRVTTVKSCFLEKDIVLWWGVDLLCYWGVGWAWRSLNYDDVLSSGSMFRAKYIARGS